MFLWFLGSSILRRISITPAVHWTFIIISTKLYLYRQCSKNRRLVRQNFEKYILEHQVNFYYNFIHWGKQFALNTILISGHCETVHCINNSSKKNVLMWHIWRFCSSCWFSRDICGTTYVQVTIYRLCF